MGGYKDLLLSTQMFEMGYQNDVRGLLKSLTGLGSLLAP